MNDHILPENPYVILAYELFWTGHHAQTGGWSKEFPDAYKFNDQTEACNVADELKNHYPDKNIGVWKDYGYSGEDEIYQAAGTRQPHRHSWRLVFPDGKLSSCEASPIIDRENQFGPITAMQPGFTYECWECHEQLTVDDPVVFKEPDNDDLLQTVREVSDQLARDVPPVRLLTYRFKGTL